MLLNIIYLYFYLKVKEQTLVQAMTSKKTEAGGETVVMSYKMEAVCTQMF